MNDIYRPQRLRRLMRACVVIALAVMIGGMAGILAGCSSVPPHAEIPVAVPCPPPAAAARPALPIAELTADSPPDTVMRAYAATVEALMGYVEELETLLDGYRADPATGIKNTN